MFNRKPKIAEFVVRHFLFWRSDFNHPDGGTLVQRQSGEQDAKMTKMRLINQNASTK